MVPLEKESEENGAAAGGEFSAGLSKLFVVRGFALELLGFDEDAPALFIPADSLASDYWLFF